MAKASNIPEKEDGNESKVVQVAQVDVPEAYNWMGDVEVGDDIVYVEKWEPRLGQLLPWNEGLWGWLEFGPRETVGKCDYVTNALGPIESGHLNF